MNLFKNFLKILGINMVAALVPWLHLGLIFGGGSVLVSAITITLVFQKELS
jgi:hypothetical protein